jgi:DNA segregation ATPase FtsK/SpoIIIE, S-DNA-T family
MKKRSDNFLSQHANEGFFILLFTLSIFFFLSLWTYDPRDLSWQNLFNGMSAPIFNSCGRVGSMISQLCLFLFGRFAYIFPLSCLYTSLAFLLKGRFVMAHFELTSVLRLLGLSILITAGCGLSALYLGPNVPMMHAGGIVGKCTAFILSQALSLDGSILCLTALILTGFTWFTGLSWLSMSEKLGFYVLSGFKSIRKKIFAAQSESMDLYNEFRTLPKIRDLLKKPEAAVTVKKQEISKINKAQPLPTLMTLKGDLATSMDTPLRVDDKLQTGDQNKGLPSLELLEKGLPSKPLGGYEPQELEALSRQVEQHLLDFGIQADVVAVHPGPVITRFELQLAAGIKAMRLTAIAKDLARSLSITSVRIVEIIPGKTVVGIELPNKDRAMVCLSDVLSSNVYQQSHCPLTLALGVDIAGHPMIVDLAKMPHLLVAGTTGSGKSVGINAMILSLLFKSSPNDVRLILIDPKMLELSVYAGIPHLLTPVVTDMKEAASALRWCVAEMERRYKLMSVLGVRNIIGFNTKVTEATANNQPILDPLWAPADTDMTETAPELSTLPYIVVVIDELADMMMVVGKKVEQLIARIAQKARAAGIHLILATQRPSVDVLTGLIKSNIPTRVSFLVSSKIDSRTILDSQGAEQLLGHGDMLFLAPGTGSSLRVHGAFVDDKEVHRVADDLRSRGEPMYIDDILQLSDNDSPGSDGSHNGGESDPLYDEAVEFIVTTKKASISALQRHFKVGYNRAARLIEDMERAGLLGPLEGGSRDVLVSNSQ